MQQFVKVLIGHHDDGIDPDWGKGVQIGGSTNQTNCGTTQTQNYAVIKKHDESMIAFLEISVKASVLPTDVRNVKHGLILRNLSR